MGHGQKIGAQAVLNRSTWHVGNNAGMFSPVLTSPHQFSEGNLPRKRYTPMTGVQMQHIEVSVLQSPWLVIPYFYQWFYLGDTLDTIDETVF